MADDIVLAIPEMGPIERLLSHPRFQRTCTVATSAAGCAFLVAIGVVMSTPARLGAAESGPTLDGAMRAVELGMRIALILVSALIGGYIALRGFRKPLARLLALSCGALSAGLGLFLLMRSYADSLGPRGLGQLLSREWLLVTVMLTSVFLMSVWMFATTKFLFYFPRPVRLMGFDPTEDGGALRLRWKADWRWLATPQFAAFAVGAALIIAIGVQGERLGSSTWTAVTLYLICWAPFAFVSAKQRHVGEEERRAIRWVLLGQSAWLVVFLLALALVAGLRAAGLLHFESWTAAETFTGSMILALLEGFIVTFLLTLVLSIFYHGTLDPDLMMGRTWVLGAVGLVSGVVFVLIERALALVLSGWLGIASIDALTIVAILTAVVTVPFRSRIERLVRRVAEGWQSAFATADGRRLDATIVFADLSGYTALSERDERAAITLAAVFHRSAAVVVEAQGGRLIKTIGDAVMMRLPTSDRAVVAVRALHDTYAARAAVLGLEPLPVHTAIHRGEVVESPDGDIFGAAVNLAARLLSAAGPNEVVASGAAVDGLNAAVSREALGLRQFKNVELPVACFRVAV